MFIIEEELKKLPSKPGVYIMHGENDEIIYVGKAISLRNRVRQYFQTSRTKGAKIDQMVTHIRRFEYIVTDSELEALVLECNLIKENRPKYNTMLTDDKTYPFIKITVNEDYPRILFTRQLKKDKAKYFGPFVSAYSVKAVIDLVKKLFKIRNCNIPLPKNMYKERLCLYYHVHQCDGPCQNLITIEEYRKNVNKAIDFLDGKVESTINELTEKMNTHSKNLEFEESIECRDLIDSIRKIMEKQKITEYGDEDRDIIAISMDTSMDYRGKDGVVSIFFMRKGKIIGREHNFMNVKEGENKEEVLNTFVKQYYSQCPYIPKEIIIPFELREGELISKWLKENTGHKVEFIVPKKGPKYKLLELAKENVNIILKKDRERLSNEEKRVQNALNQLKDIIGIDQLNRMEAYDISNTSGLQSVGSMIVFVNGKPKPSDYRKFKIRTVKGPNDYGSMEEVLTRRFTHSRDKEFDSFSYLPDIILMDGGKGQVNIAKKVLKELNLDIKIVGMIKDDNHNTRGLIVDNKEYDLSKSQGAFNLVTQIQDEAHRFAINYHRSLRQKEAIHSVLDDIKGVGEIRRKNLLKHFKSVENISKASIEELTEVNNITENIAIEIYKFFNKRIS